MWETPQSVEKRDIFASGRLWEKRRVFMDKKPEKETNAKQQEKGQTAVNCVENRVTAGN